MADSIPLLTGVRSFDRTVIALPTLGPDEVRVNVKAVSICGSDLRAYRGEHPAIRPPTVLGHEFSGEISEVGSNVAGLEVGNRVVGDPTLSCGTCRHCVRGRSNICAEYTVIGRNLSHPGALAGSVVLPSSHIHRLSDRVSFSQGALVQPLSVGYHAVAHRSNTAPGDVVLVAGAGAIGLGVVLAGVAAGLKVLVSEPSAWRRDLALELGAQVAIDPSTDDLRDAAMAISDGYGVDAAFEAVGTGSESFIGDLVAATAAGGTTIILGLKSDSGKVPIRELKYREKTLTGSQAHPQSMGEVARRMANGGYDASRLITHELSLAEVPTAFEILDRQSEGVVKIVIHL